MRLLLEIVCDDNDDAFVQLVKTEAVLTGHYVLSDIDTPFCDMPPLKTIYCLLSLGNWPERYVAHLKEQGLNENIHEAEKVFEDVLLRGCHQLEAIFRDITLKEGLKLGERFVVGTKQVPTSYYEGVLAMIRQEHDIDVEVSEDDELVPAYSIACFYGIY